jgi:hypothetical protein
VNARLALLIAVVARGCSEDDPAPRLDQLGDPCRGGTHVCVNEHRVTRCVDQIIVETDCDDVCAELGPAWIADGCDGECVCVPADPSGCWPGQTNCVNEQILEVCGDSQTWEGIDCEELCAAVSLSSVGCAVQADELSGGLTAACSCSGEGTPCDPTAPRVCVDATSLASCEDGSWVFRDCAEICAGPSQCVPWQTPATCAC